MDTCVVCGGYVVEGSRVCKKCVEDFRQWVEETTELTMDRHELTETLTLDEVDCFRQIQKEAVKWFNGEVSAERFAEKVYGLLNRRKDW